MGRANLERNLGEIPSCVSRAGAGMWAGFRASWAMGMFCWGCSPPVPGCSVPLLLVHRECSGCCEEQPSVLNAKDSVL